MLSAVAAGKQTLIVERRVACCFGKELVESSIHTMNSVSSKLSSSSLRRNDSLSASASISLKILVALGFSAKTGSFLIPWKTCRSSGSHHKRGKVAVTAGQMGIRLTAGLRRHPSVASLIASSQLAQRIGASREMITAQCRRDRLTFSQEIQPTQSPTHLHVASAVRQASAGKSLRRLLSKAS